MVRYLWMVFILGILVVTGNCLGQESSKPFVVIGTGGVTGVYYAAGHAVAKVFGRVGEKEDFRLDAESSQGSVENINKVLSGEWAFGIAQADMLYKARNGLGPWQGATNNNLRSVAALHLEAVTVVVATELNVHSVCELKGKRVGIGAFGSSDEQNARDILMICGIDPEKHLQLSIVSVSDAPEMLQKGMLDAYFFTVGHPNLSLWEATFGNREVKVLSLEKSITDLAIQHMPSMIRTTIPINYYQRLETGKSVNTIGTRAVFFTSAKVPDHQVYSVLQALVDELPRFQRQHPAFAKITLTDLPHGNVVPLHPAASVVYRERGILK